jgi:hypothetical protein
MGRGFLKGVVLGAIVSTIVLAAASALAGTGVGAVFNLGKTNSVDKPSTLTGTTSGKMLNITNRGSGPALGLKVAGGTAPFTVSSGMKVAKLNADKLDGIDSTRFIHGVGDAFVKDGAADLSGVVDPSENRTALGSIPGLGSFTVGGAILGPGGDCDITFTNTSGAALVVNGAANPGLADAASIELAGTSTRPDGVSTTFTIATANAATVATGQVVLTFGFPGAGNVVCAGSVQALVSN